MGHGDSGGPGLVETLRSYLPRGNMLDAETFGQRHRVLCWILGLHVPALFVFGVWQGYGLGHSALEVVTPIACLLFARLARNRRVSAFFITAGLVFCSSALVHLSGGVIEAHFHFFVLIGLIALYQDWVPFLWNVVFTVLSHGVGSVVAADLMFNHGAAQNRPWSWAVIHGVAVLAASVGVVIFWRSTELEQQRNNSLAQELGASEVNAAQAEASQRRSMSDLLVNLARRNQSLLNRQLTLIAELEQREREPEALAELFHLDHLATRIRRNAESLLVLSGDDPPRLWGRPMPLSEVVRAAAAEVEDYGRVEVLVNDHIEVAGRAVADLAHLLAELIENATTFSPPVSPVRVRSHLAPTNWSSYMVSIEDVGIGMSDEDLVAANEVLTEPHDVDMRRATLGFHVVSRLAKRYHLDVRVAQTPGGGLTALVTLPNELVTESTVDGSRTPAPFVGPSERHPRPEPTAVAAAPYVAPAGVLAPPAPAALPAPPPPALAPAPVAASASVVDADAAPAWTTTPLPEVPAAAVVDADAAPAWTTTPVPELLYPMTSPSGSLDPVARTERPSRPTVGPGLPPLPSPPPPPPSSLPRLSTPAAFVAPAPPAPPSPDRDEPADVPAGESSFDSLDRREPGDVPDSLEQREAVAASAPDALDRRQAADASGTASSLESLEQREPADVPDLPDRREPGDVPDSLERREAPSSPDAMERREFFSGAAPLAPPASLDRRDSFVVPVPAARAPSLERRDPDIAPPPPPSDAVVDAPDTSEPDPFPEPLAEPAATDAGAVPEPVATNGSGTTTDNGAQAEAEAEAAGEAAAAVTPEPADDPSTVLPATTADGLVRRVPGAGLAAALKRDPMRQAGSSSEVRPVEALDREAVRSMLSQFQASQRAGRAIADTDVPVDLRSPEEET